MRCLVVRIQKFNVTRPTRRWILPNPRYCSNADYRDALLTLHYHSCNLNKNQLDTVILSHEETHSNLPVLLGTIKLLRHGWMEQSLTPHSTQYRSFRRRSSQPITSLILTNKTVQENTDKQTQYKSEKSRQTKIQHNKTNLVQLPLTTLGQETRWAYSTTLPSPHGAAQT